MTTFVEMLLFEFTAFCSVLLLWNWITFTCHLQSLGLSI